MEKREHERINVIMAAEFSCGSSYYSQCLGTIMNISENGMRIESCKCLPLNTEGKIVIFSNNNDVHVPIKISRLIKDNGFYDAMGIEILNPTLKYIELVTSLKSDS